MNIRRAIVFVALLSHSAFMGSSRRGLADEGPLLSDQSIVEYPITPSDREHWSYQPIVRPALPVPVSTPPREVPSGSSLWSQTEIDSFILHELTAKRLSPLPSADRGTLLRRLSYDLLGLPPSPAELLAFEQDDSPNAYEKLIDRLLASPAYGERWAQHWLDLARFAETDGFEHDNVRKDAWQYRQWVVDAFNADMPYDRFVHLQLTGDMTGDKQDSIATMFCLAGPDMPDLNEQSLRRHDKLNEITSTVGSVLLGFQMHCAQCHDHKYDPISQADFYRLRGVFESSIPDLQRDEPLLQLASQSTPVTPRIYYRGELENLGPIVEAKPPRIACTAEVFDHFDSTTPRKSLSQWLFAEDNPITSRVIANRVWQHHFGKSLCENPSDVGLVASGPSHPELLDWLALELRENAWSLKHLHRVILRSAIYRQSSHPIVDDAGSMSQWDNIMTVDAANNLYSRFPRQRLDGEIIRDAMLSVSGQLSHRYGGQSVMPPLPQELLRTLLPGQWQTSRDPSDHVRRSVYLFSRRNLRYPIFDAFDRPDAAASCARRDRSTTAIQSLQMLNSDLTFQAASSLRDSLLRDALQRYGDATPESLIEQLFLKTLSRHPSKLELQRLSGLLNSSANQADGLLVVCMAVLNSNEFIYVD